MRVNGNYFERFLFSTLPFIFLGAVVFYRFKESNVFAIIIGTTIFSLLLFSLDKFPLRRTKLLPCNIKDEKLFFAGKEIDVNEIDIIRPHKTPPPQSLLFFEVYLRDSSQLAFMDRPKTIFYKSKNKLRSKSLDILFGSFPHLKNKLRAQRN
jgi:hypothetical protein